MTYRVPHFLILVAVTITACVWGCDTQAPSQPIEPPPAVEQSAPEAPASTPTDEPASGDAATEASVTKDEPATESEPEQDDELARVNPGATRAMVPMRDGVKLATDYYLPKGDGPFPVVLARSVYDINAAGGIGAVFNANLIALVTQDQRGYHRSEGEDFAFADEGWGENQDGVDTLAWIREQPWCNGKIGTFGMSALAISSQLLAAASNTITAQVSMVGCSDFYGFLSYQGGVFRKSLVEGWLDAQGSPHVYAAYKQHPADDEFWRGYDVNARVEQITAPGYHVGGWFDIFGQSTLDSYTSQQHAGGEGARGNQKLLMGAWIHTPSLKQGDLTMPKDFLYDFNSESLKFLKHWLTGDDNGIMDDPPVRYYTLGDVEDPSAPGNEWRTADDWPPFETVETEMYLHDDGTLASESTDNAEGSLTFTYDPANPCPTHGGANLILDAGPMDQREVSGRTDVLRFATEPLESPIEITGRVSVRLFISSDAPDTDFTAKLIDIYPDGREILMLDNIQRVKFRNGFSAPDPLPIGEIGMVEIDLWSISLIVNKGHRIGVQISSSNYPRFEKNPNTGADFPTEGGELRVAKNTVYMDKEHASALILPIRKES